tara:strand:- start:33 stop:299 length:267 start_codon:yes stop_codon:yes gene_type:complete
MASLFSFFYIDLNLFRKREKGYSNSTGISIEITSRKEKLKQKKRKYQNRKYKRKKYYRHKHYRLKGSESKDSRYSNQKDIRRMHTSYA